MKKQSFLVIVLLGAFLLLGTAAATGQQGHRPPPIQTLDTDGDGRISEAEWLQHHAARFNEIDTNGDGYLSEDEMKAHHATMQRVPGRRSGDNEGGPREER